MFLSILLTLPVLFVGVAVSYLITCGMAKVYLDGINEKPVNADQVFSGFNKNCFHIIGGMAWMGLWILIWALVPFVGIILAIIKSYSYRFVPYILITRPEVSATQALRVSMDMTKGKKGHMFLADLIIVGGYFVTMIMLGPLSLLPFVGSLFSLIEGLLFITYMLFGGIFEGLYSAAFYEMPKPEFKSYTYDDKESVTI